MTRETCLRDLLWDQERAVEDDGFELLTHDRGNVHFLCVVGVGLDVHELTHRLTAGTASGQYDGAHIEPVLVRMPFQERDRLGQLDYRDWVFDLRRERVVEGNKVVASVEDGVRDDRESARSDGCGIPFRLITQNEAAAVGGDVRWPVHAAVGIGNIDVQVAVGVLGTVLDVTGETCPVARDTRMFLRTVGFA